MGEDLRFGEGFGGAQDSFPVAPPQSSLAPFATRISYRRCGHDLLGTIVPLASFYRVVFHRLYGALNIDQVTNGCSKLTQRTGSLSLSLARETLDSTMYLSPYASASGFRKRPEYCTRILSNCFSRSDHDR